MSASGQRRFRVNTPTVAAEAVDGEVIIVNLLTGTYYSLLGTGGAVWEMLEAGATVNEVEERLRVDHREADPATVAGAVDEFVNDLEAEALIVPEPSGGARDDDREPTSNPNISTANDESSPQTNFVAPRLERYIELQNLIQLDPILAVDERGWPVAEPR